MGFRNLQEKVEMNIYFLCIEKYIEFRLHKHCTEVRFASCLSAGFTTISDINPQKKETGKTHLCALHCFSILINYT